MHECPAHVDGVSRDENRRDVAIGIRVPRCDRMICQHVDERRLRRPIDCADAAADDPATASIRGHGENRTGDLGKALLGVP